MLAASTDFWAYGFHPEVWVLLFCVLGFGFYASRVIAPKIERRGEVGITTANRAWFAFGFVLLWLASDWPMHDIAEEYLYSVHMVQHMLLTFLIPPVFLMATPPWLARLILGNGSFKTWVYRLARPVPAALIFNGLAILTHWSGLVNATVANGALHYSVHALMVASAFLLWMPVCGPIDELRISLPNQMVYLFLTSIIPTVPAGWLTFAEGVVYDAYDIPERMYGISVTSDQQAAGLIMKLIGGTYLFVIITVLFFRWADRHERAQRAGRIHISEREVLTWSDVESELEVAGPAIREPVPRPTPPDG